MTNLEKAERDAIVFLGLLSKAHKQFDPQIVLDDTETHTVGLNIFAAIIDNADGNVLAQERNTIHSEANPMLHAEQHSLRSAVDAVRKKRPRKPTTSVENYYRTMLFYDKKRDYWDVGSTIYTTLEPCPFCASALLVTRMKRVVYIIPDPKFGKAYRHIQIAHYDTYDTRYEQLKFADDIPPDKLIDHAKDLYKKLLENVSAIKKVRPDMYDTLLLDLMPELLKEGSDIFATIKPRDITSGNLSNIRTLKEFV
jgi:tRNA(Arg) A34 adenosine deaminase TadA